jgi:alkanesulfonate monooxygenase SsuD/methylene tetrahydromethanopterin reductase-like flavin-dependent oxidoreductase (luciferase family)
MTDYGQDLLFGTFVTPTNQPVQRAVEQAVVADRAGLDLVTFQDHPYVAKFHDTWTLITYAAARTERIHLTANVTNLPLRQPAVLARTVATADLLSGGRIDLGLGAGGFWDAIEAMGGRRLTPGQSITALEEAVEIIRGIWDADTRGGLTVEGELYTVRGAKRGPAPAHRPGIWVGGYKPRILRTVGRIADGVLPSLQYLSGGIEDLVTINEHIDTGAQAVGRDPREIRRFLNIGGRFSSTSDGFLQGPPDQWVEELTDLTLSHGVTGFILASDDTDITERYAAEVAPAVRREVQQARG